MTHNDLRYEFGPYQLDPIKRTLTALGNGRTGPKHIETVARRGYRFTRSVSVDEREFEDLAGGLTHNVINNLSRISRLRVMLHSAAFHYMAKIRDPQPAGRRSLGLAIVG